jgi:ADP-heptose:LPS heptosyltransferase
VAAGENVLILRAGALGDLLLLRPTLAALHASGHAVHLLAPLAAGRALVGPGAAEALVASDGPELAAALADGFGDGPAARAIDAAGVVVAYTRSAPLLARLAARARRLLAQDPAPPADGPHAAAWLARAVAPLVSESSLMAAQALETKPLSWSDDERQAAERLTQALPRDFLALHPGSGSPSKNWPFERCLEAAAQLAEGEPWLFVAGPAEAALAGPPGAVVARDWPLRTLGAALARAGLFVGNDAGVSHLAAATGAPTLALFGPTDPALWAPVGPRAATLRAPGGSLGDLDVAEVVAAGRRLRSAAGGPPSGR